MLLTTLFLAYLAVGTEDCKCPTYAGPKEVYTCAPYGKEYYIALITTERTICNEQVQCPWAWVCRIKGDSRSIYEMEVLDWPFGAIKEDVKCQSCGDWCTKGISKAGKCNEDLECILDRDAIRKISCFDAECVETCGAEKCCGTPCIGNSKWNGFGPGFCSMLGVCKANEPDDFNFMTCQQTTDCKNLKCGTWCYLNWGSEGKCNQHGECKYSWRSIRCPLTEAPTMEPTTLAPTLLPGTTHSPTTVPTRNPSVCPTVKPTGNPSIKPTQSPSIVPTVRPTSTPTFSPVDPTFEPTPEPTIYTPPSLSPTACPTVKPSTPFPTCKPTGNPSSKPTIKPTGNPSIKPTQSPSIVPTLRPTLTPTFSPVDPTFEPTPEPTIYTPPSLSPTACPTFKPTQPTSKPTRTPTEACSAKERRLCDQNICEWKKNKCSVKEFACWEWTWAERCSKMSKKFKIECFWDNVLKVCLSGKPEDDKETTEDKPDENETTEDKFMGGPLRYDQFKDWCIDHVKKDECSKYQCGPWKGALRYCIPTKKKNVKCAKFKSQGICELVGCNFKSGKCKGTPFKK